VLPIGIYVRGCKQGLLNVEYHMWKLAFKFIFEIRWVCEVDGRAASCLVRTVTVRGSKQLTD